MSFHNLVLIDNSVVSQILIQIYIVPIEVHMKFFVATMLIGLASCNIQVPESLVDEIPEISDGAITTVPKIPGGFSRAKYLVEDQFFIKKCNYLGEFHGKGYYESIELDFSSDSGTYRQLYNISEDYLNLRDGSCGHGLLNSKLSVYSEYDYSFINGSTFDGVLRLQEQFIKATAIIGDSSVLPVLSSIFLRDGKMICNTNWTTQPQGVEIDVTNRLYCPVQSLASGVRYNNVTLNDKFELLMGEYTSARDGSTQALSPAPQGQSMLRSYSYSDAPVVSGDEDLFLSRRQMWGGTSSSCTDDGYGVWEYVQFDTSRSGRVIQRYYDCDTFTDVINIESRFNLALENRLASSPLAYNVRLDVTSSVMQVLNTRGAELVNDLWICDVSSAVAGGVYDIYGLEPLYHCSLFTQGTIYSKLEMTNHNSAKLGFPKALSNWGNSPDDRANTAQNMVEFSL